MMFTAACFVTHIYTHKHVHTCTVLMAGFFLGEPALAGCRLIFLLHLFLDCASSEDRPKLYMFSLTQSHVPPSLPWMTMLPCFINLNRHTDFDPVVVILRLHSTCPNCPSLLLLISKLTGFSPDNSSISAFLGSTP